MLLPAPLLQDLPARVAGDELALHPDAAKAAAVAARHDRRRHGPPRSARHRHLRIRRRALGGAGWDRIDRKGSSLHRRCVRFARSPLPRIVVRIYVRKVKNRVWVGDGEDAL
jgi:hypothetical protein